MSDVLPFTAQDSMSQETVQNTPAPPGFARRDAPAVQSRQDSTPLQQQAPTLPVAPSPPPLHPVPPQGATGGGGGYAVKQKPQEDIDIEDQEDQGAKPNDISNYKKVSDLIPILVAVLAIDVAVIFLARFFPEIFGASINRWYDMFGLNAVLCDVLIIFIGFLLARYAYTNYIKDKYAEGKWNPMIFTVTLVLIQVVHDVLFYLGVIKQLPRGQNAMIDTMKDYAASGGAKIIFADALMMVGSSAAAMALKTQPAQMVASFASIVAQALPYILQTRNVFSLSR